MALTKTVAFDAVTRDHAADFLRNQARNVFAGTTTCRGRTVRAPRGR
jgi:hypothetical protein